MGQLLSHVRREGGVPCSCPILLSGLVSPIIGHAGPGVSTANSV
jgi:hypothetical protein